MALTMNDIQAKASTGTLTQRLAKYLLGELSGTDKNGNAIDPVQFYNKDNILASANQAITDGMDSGLAQKMATARMTEANRLAPFLSPNGLGNAKFGDWAKLAGTAAVHHPFKTAGLVGLGAGNLGGLMDNNKIGGQLGGLALVGLGASMLGANPYTAAMLTLGGGELGNLFDKLRARKEQEQSQYYGKDR